MEQAIWWLGAIHVVAYATVGSIWLASWLMHRAFRYLGLWKYVMEGLAEKRRRERIPG